MQMLNLDFLYAKYFVLLIFFYIHTIFGKRRAIWKSCFYPVFFCFFVYKCLLIFAFMYVFSLT